MPEPRPNIEMLPGSRGRLRILVAEDDDLNQQLMRQLLGRRGHEATIAGDGRQTLAQLESSIFDVLLLDVQLPDIDGFEVIQAVRQRERSSGEHLHVVAITARARKEDRAACLASGMDDFLPKPISAAALWAILDRLGKARPPSSLIDPRVLLAACGRNGEILMRVSAGLKASLPERILAVERAFEQRDAVQLREMAHRLSGVVSPFSTVAGGLAAELEDRAARGDLSVSALVEKLAAIGPALVREVGAVSLDALRSSEP